MEIERQIRALYPWPGTWTVAKNGKKIKIIKASMLNKTGKNKESGKIVVSENKKMAVLCGQGSLILECIQPEGKKEMSGEEFMRGLQTANKLFFL
jgi:methionyl-tRNA formyltransferase